MTSGGLNPFRVLLYCMMVVILGVSIYCNSLVVYAEEPPPVFQDQEEQESSGVYEVSPDVDISPDGTGGYSLSMLDDIHVIRYIMEMVYRVWFPLVLVGALALFLYRWIYRNFVGI